jgi:hypothetical protein
LKQGWKMTDDKAAANRPAVEKLLKDHGLTRHSVLYREAMRQTLIPTDKPGVFRLPANSTPNESVVDVYGQGYLVQAENVGPGLAFAQSARPNWQETVEMRVLRDNRDRTADVIEVEVRLDDVLRQGGLVYPVQSVTVERAWYCTLPEQSVEVREAI